MKTNPTPLLKCVIAVCVLQLAALSSQAQSNFVAATFDTEATVIDNNGNPWGNWFGTAFYQTLWYGTNAFNDANGNTDSGSLRVENFFPDSGIGGCCGPQFLAYNQNDGFNPPVAGNGAGSGIPVATNLEFDVRIVAGSVYYTNQVTNANWPTLEVGTRGVDFNQYNFGTFTFPATNASDLNTNWIHVSMPIAASENWVTIPNIFFKHYGPTLNGWFIMHIDNIVFNMAEVEIAPPTLTIKPAKPALRMFAGNSQYARTQVATVDTNQSWVGGSYPVSYSFTLSDYDINPSVNEFHMFLTPLNYIQGGGIDQYTDYSTASNNLRLQIVGGDYGTTPVVAQLDYKTNAINANPSEVVANITNDTAIGTWTVAFSSATDGTLTAPGASPVAFSLPADVAATFANPLVAFFGVQPNDPANLGQQLDFTHIQTANIASPGVPVNTDFTTGASIDTNIWRTASVSADVSNLVIVDSSQPWWLNWGYPDIGFTLSTKADLSDLGVQWKTPAYFTGYDTNNPILKKTLGSRVATLIPQDALPTLNGLSNGVTGNSAFFRMENPAPAE